MHQYRNYLFFKQLSPWCRKYLTKKEQKKNPSHPAKSILNHLTTHLSSTPLVKIESKRRISSFNKVQDHFCFKPKF